jgi:hypothetical protein
VASAIIPYSIMTTGIRNSFIAYIAASILSFILVGPKAEPAAYGVLFGLYGFVKYYIEALNKIVFEIILKLVYFNICFFVLYKLYTAIFTSTLSTELPIYALIGGAQIAFFIYDYALTIIINYIRRRFIKN